MQNALEVRPYLRVITLLKQSDPSLKFEVFTRLNRGGELMTPQELRNVAYRGPLNDLIYSLSENRFLRQQLKIKSNKSQAYRLMVDAEYVLRFLTLRERWTHFSGNYRIEMDRFMQDNQGARDEQLVDYERSFTVAIEACEAIWGEESFKRPALDGWRDQLLAGMYDAEMVAINQVPLDVHYAASERSSLVKSETRALFNDPLLDQAVRQGTNTPRRIIYRIEALIDLLTRVAQ